MVLGERCGLRLGVAGLAVLVGRVCDGDVLELLHDGAHVVLRRGWEWVSV